ncbi:MAG: hypothetical protein JNL62_01610 [Bryobacterales bacterium]|nr:hypothetical protein [Bryobacterales bacterium]
MKNFQYSLLIASLMTPASAFAQQPTGAAAPPAEKDVPPVAQSGSNLFLGTRVLDNNGWPGRVNEYEMNKGGARPSIGFDYWYSRESWFFNFFGENRGDSRAQSYSLEADLNRRLRIRSTLERFIHRYDHDPLSNLDVAKGSVVVRHDNLTPNRAYGPGRNEFSTEVSGVINEWLSWRASHRFLQIHGDTQTRSISKCANCHVTGEATRINQKMHDVSAGLTVRLGRRASVLYDYWSRQFKEDGERPTNQYDVAQHPTTLNRAFFNRVLYDGTTDGQMHYAYVPNFRKDSHDIKLNVDLPADSRLSAQLLKTSATNKHVQLGLDVLAWGGKYTIPIHERVTFKAQFRKADMHSDDVFIELQEPANPAGVAQPGQTFAQAYPDFGSVDWTRGSSINRVDALGSAEISARLAKLTTLRGGYQFRSIRRENFEVERTDRNRLYLLFSSRRSKQWNSRVRYTFEATDQPFLHRHAALSPVLQPFAAPGNPPSPLLGTQYFVMYAARQANLTNQPTRSQFIEPSFTWTPSPKAALTLHYRAKMEKNDKLNFGHWKRDMHMPGAELWVAPLEKLNFTIGYSLQNDKSSTLFVIPVFDG